jgi:hypothetical protein
MVPLSDHYLAITDIYNKGNNKITELHNAKANKMDEYTNNDSKSRHFQQYVNYIVAASFIGGGNRSTRKKTTDLPQVSLILL